MIGNNQKLFIVPLRKNDVIQYKWPNDRSINRLNYHRQASINFNWQLVGQCDVIFYMHFKKLITTWGVFICCPILWRWPQWRTTFWCVQSWSDLWRKGWWRNSYSASVPGACEQLHSSQLHLELKVDKS